MGLSRSSHFNPLWTAGGSTGGGTGGTGGGGTGVGTIVNTGPYTNLPGWQLIFNEGFGTTTSMGGFLTSSGNYAKGVSAYAATWNGQNYLTTYGTPSHGNTGDYYGTSNIGVVSGITGANGNCLQINMLVNDGTGKKVGGNPAPNLSGTPGTNPSASSKLYMRYSIRFKTDGVKGWKAVPLLWPKSYSWTNEVDFPEASFNGTIQGYVHTPNNASTNAASYTGGSATTTSWHECAVEWTSTGVKYFLDGTQVLNTSTHPAEQMFLMLQTENSLNGGSSQPIANGTCWYDSVGIWIPA